MGPRADLEALENKKISCHSGELNRDSLVLQPTLCKYVKLYVKALLKFQFQVLIEVKQFLFKGWNKKFLKNIFF
jgi:hypothetical protein